MFKRLIVAIDVSTRSSDILEYLSGLKSVVHECALLLCLTVEEGASIALSYSAEKVESILAEEKELLEKFGFTVKAKIVPGFAVAEVNRMALEDKYDLIIAGQTDRSILNEIVQGGIARELIHHKVKKPLLLIPVKNKAVGKNRDFFENVLFATDFSENSDKAFLTVQELVETRAKKITLFHVQNKTNIEPHLKNRLQEFNQIDKGRLEKLKEIIMKKSKASVDIEVTYGYPAQEIVNIAKKRGVSLTILGTRGRGYVNDIFLGSISHAVARKIENPLLLVPIK